MKNKINFAYEAPRLERVLIETNDILLVSGEEPRGELSNSFSGAKLNLDFNDIWPE